MYQGTLVYIHYTFLARKKQVYNLEKIAINNLKNIKKASAYLQTVAKATAKPLIWDVKIIVN